MYRRETAAGEKRDGAEDSPARDYLQRFLQENAESLQGILCGYVTKMGLASGGDAAAAIAAEVFQDAVLETLTHADKFNPNMQARPWFLAIAANILKRHRASYARRYRFEVLVGSLAHPSQEANEQDILDQIMYERNEPGPEQDILSSESVREMFALISREDAQLLHMALVQGWDASALGELMHITPGAARVRIHRALSRLRAAWRASEQRKEQGK